MERYLEDRGKEIEIERERGQEGRKGDRKCLSSGSNSFILFFCFGVVVFVAVSQKSVRTWRMVSKLKVSPFQRVNSPLDAPVINRRPSGVHWKFTK